MKNIFFYLYFYLISFLISIKAEIETPAANKTLTWYNFETYDQNNIFNLIPIPKGSSYSSNNTCVTFNDLIAYNYTDLFEKWDNPNRVYPDNFCYSMLTYNISREDFFDIVNKNLSKIKIKIKRLFIITKK